MRRIKHKIALTTFLALTMSIASFAKANRQAAALSRKKIVKVGKASWYSKRSPGIKKRTANNEIFNDQVLTAAMWDVPFHQKVRVTNLDNGKSIIVRINDRGPHRRYHNNGRIIDLTKEAFSYIGSPKKGLIKVEVELL